MRVANRICCKLTQKYIIIFWFGTFSKVMSRRVDASWLLLHSQQTNDCCRFWHRFIFRFCSGSGGPGEEVSSSIITFPSSSCHCCLCWWLLTLKFVSKCLKILSLPWWMERNLLMSHNPSHWSLRSHLDFTFSRRSRHCFPCRYVDSSWVGHE